MAGSKSLKALLPSPPPVMFAREKCVCRSALTFVWGSVNLGLSTCVCRKRKGPQERRCSCAEGVIEAACVVTLSKLNMLRALHDSQFVHTVAYVHIFLFI